MCRGHRSVEGIEILLVEIIVIAEHQRDLRVLARLALTDDPGLVTHGLEQLGEICQSGDNGDRTISQHLVYGDGADLGERNSDDLGISVERLVVGANFVYKGALISGDVLVLAILSGVNQLHIGKEQTFSLEQEAVVCHHLLINSTVVGSLLSQSLLLVLFLALILLSEELILLFDELLRSLERLFESLEVALGLYSTHAREHELRRDRRSSGADVADRVLGCTLDTFDDRGCGDVLAVAKRVDAGKDVGVGIGLRLAGILEALHESGPVCDLGNYSRASLLSDHVRQREIDLIEELAGGFLKVIGVVVVSANISKEIVGVSVYKLGLCHPHTRESCDLCQVITSYLQQISAVVHESYAGVLGGRNHELGGGSLFQKLVGFLELALISALSSLDPLLKRKELRTLSRRSLALEHAIYLSVDTLCRLLAPLKVLLKLLLGGNDRTLSLYSRDLSIVQLYWSVSGSLGLFLDGLLGLGLLGELKLYRLLGDLLFDRLFDLLFRLICERLDSPQSLCRRIHDLICSLARIGEHTDLTVIGFLHQAVALSESGKLGVLGVCGRLDGLGHRRLGLLGIHRRSHHHTVYYVLVSRVGLCHLTRIELVGRHRRGCDIAVIVCGKAHAHRGIIDVQANVVSVRGYHLADHKALHSICRCKLALLLLGIHGYLADRLAVDNYLRLIDRLVGNIYLSVNL